MRPVLVDLFCGRTGGGAFGYSAAGFHVVGMDLIDGPDYPGTDFEQGDVLANGLDLIRAWNPVLIHASPPCQGEGYLAKGSSPELAARHPQLVEPTRRLLESTGIPYVIENVGGSSVRPDVTLCGEMFGLGVIMHRKFELGGWSATGPAHVPHRGHVRGWRHGVWRDGPYVAAYGKGGGKATVDEMRAAKGIHWSNDHKGLRDALPPAYTEWIGREFMSWTRSGGY